MTYTFAFIIIILAIVAILIYNFRKSEIDKINLELTKPNGKYSFESNGQQYRYASIIDFAANNVTNVTIPLFSGCKQNFKTLMFLNANKKPPPCPIPEGQGIVDSADLEKLDFGFSEVDLNRIAKFQPNPQIAEWEPAQFKVVLNIDCYKTRISMFSKNGKEFKGSVSKSDEYLMEFLELKNLDSGSNPYNLKMVSTHFKNNSEIVINQKMYLKSTVK